MERCRDRYGDAFTLRLQNEGTWVMLSDPAAVKQVFTGDPRLLHAGEAAGILRPILGPNSVLLLDERAHMTQRKLLLPPFHGERMKAYGELMTARGRGGDRVLARGRGDRDPPRDAADHARDRHARDLRRVRRWRARAHARRAAVDARLDHRPVPAGVAGRGRAEAHRDGCPRSAA